MENKILEELVVDFLEQFFTVFDSDWNYTQLNISKMDNYDKLDIEEGENWQNGYELLCKYENLIEILKKEDVFKRIFENNGIGYGTALFAEKFNL